MLKKRVYYSDSSSSDGERNRIKKHKSKLNNNKYDPMTLTDLKDGFLLRTFDELSLDDLSSVAMVNKRFNRLVYSYLGEQCSMGRVTVRGTHAANWLWTSTTMGKFKFDSPAELVAFLRTSGHLILHLTIDYQAPCYHDVERVIFKYCMNASHIELRTTFLPVLNATTKHPLPDVTVLQLDTCQLDAKFGEQLNRLCPSLQRLVLNDCNVDDPACIEINVPDLIEFKFNGLMKKRQVLKKQHILNFIELNPQIQRFAVDFQAHQTSDKNADDFELDSTFYRCVCEYLPALDWLKMFGKRHNHAPIACCDANIEFSQLRTFELVDIYDHQPDQIAPFQFQQLQELQLIHMKKLTDEWTDFIASNEQLTKLTVQIYGTWSVKDKDEVVVESRHKISKEQLLAMLKYLPHLEELHVDAETVNTKDVVAVLAKRKSLTTIGLREYFLVDSIVETFERLLAKKSWRVDYDLENLYLKRV